MLTVHKSFFFLNWKYLKNLKKVASKINRKSNNLCSWINDKDPDETEQETFW